MLAKNGARCSKEEQKWLGNKFTDFLQSIRLVDAPKPNFSQQQPENRKLPVQKDAFIQQEASESANAQCSELQQLKKHAEREEIMQMQLWKSKQSLTQQIKSLNELQFISKIAHGCDAVVFNCSASQLGIPSVALKILFNLGINTSRLQVSFSNEYEILRSLPFHINIVPIWSDFQDRPTQQFIDQFPPDLKDLVVNAATGTVRATTCILMPTLESFDVFFKREFRRLTVIDKLAFISDIISGLLFLFENDVVHRDMKLNNLLLNSTGRIVISDFGCSTKISPKKILHIAPGGSVGGNLMHLAPEIRKINTGISETAVLVDYSKQPGFELGMLAFEIMFGELPELNVFGEQMDDQYFLLHCPDDSHKIPQMFNWMRHLMLSNPLERTGLLEAGEYFSQIL